MLLIMRLRGISVNLLKPESTTTLVELLINPTLAMHIVGSFYNFIIMSVVFRAYILLIARGADSSLTLKRVFFMVYLYAYSEIFLVKSIELFIFPLCLFLYWQILLIWFSLGRSNFGDNLNLWTFTDSAIFGKRLKLVLDIPYLTIVVARWNRWRVFLCFVLSLIRENWVLKF